MTLNIAWVADLGNGDEHTLETSGRSIVPMRALYEIEPTTRRLVEAAPALHPAGTL